jgi:ankyrin repeat protein
MKSSKYNNRYPITVLRRYKGVFDESMMASVGNFHLNPVREDVFTIKSPLHSAAALGDVYKVARTVTHNNVDDADLVGATPLHYAVACDKPEAVEELLKYEPDLTITFSHTETTCLGIAAQLDTNRCAQLLIGHMQKKLDAANTSRYKDLAVIFNNVPRLVLKRILQLSEDRGEMQAFLDKQDCVGQTALMEACANPNPNSHVIVKALLEAGASTHINNDMQRQALWFVVFSDGAADEEATKKKHCLLYKEMGLTSFM